MCMRLVGQSSGIVDGRGMEERRKNFRNDVLLPTSVPTKRCCVETFAR